MPPQVTDEDIEDGSVGSGVEHDEPVASVAANGGEDGDDGSGEDDEDEEAYVVEAIVGHKGKPNNVLYLIKWAGYEEDQNTYEPIDNILPNARDALAAYHRKIGGDPAQSKSVKRAKSLGDLKPSDASSPAPKRLKKEDSRDEGWMPSKPSWEALIEKIEHIERDEQTNELVAFIRWRDRSRPNTKVSMERVYQHCPVKMCKFYEAHLKFTMTPDP